MRAHINATVAEMIVANWYRENQFTRAEADRCANTNLVALRRGETFELNGGMIIQFDPNENSFYLEG